MCATQPVHGYHRRTNRNWPFDSGSQFTLIRLLSSLFNNPPATVIATAGAHKKPKFFSHSPDAKHRLIRVQPMKVELFVLARVHSKRPNDGAFQLTKIWKVNMPKPSTKWKIHPNELMLDNKICERRLSSSMATSKRIGAATNASAGTSMPRSSQQTTSTCTKAAAKRKELLMKRRRRTLPPKEHSIQFGLCQSRFKSQITSPVQFVCALLVAQSK